MPNPAPNATTPKPSHTPKYPAATAKVPSDACASSRKIVTRLYSSSIGQVDGSIIANIIACHMNRNIHAVFQTLSPGITIHIMGIVQPPGICMPPPILRTPYSVTPAAIRKMVVAAARAYHDLLGAREFAANNGE